MEIAIRVAFSADAGPENIRDPAILAGAAEGHEPAIGVAVRRANPDARNRRYAEARDRLRAAMARMVAHHRESGADPRRRAVSMLTAGDHPNGHMTDQQIADELMSTAGCRHAGAVRVDLLDAVPPGHDREVDRRVTPSRSPRPGYLDQVATETLRMHPPVWVATRRAINDVLRSTS